MASAPKAKLFWLLLIIIAAVLSACEGGEEELGQSLDRSAKTSPTPVMFEGDPTCGLAGQPTVTPWPDQVDPWAVFSPEAITARAMESDLVVRGRVSVSEQHYPAEAPNDRYQDVCLAVTDVLRGDAAG
jgi:hypothetical protein